MTGETDDGESGTGRGDHDHHGSPGDGRHEHEHHADDADSVAVAVLTISTSRTLESDPSGDAIVASLESEGHDVVRRGLVGDDPTAIREWVETVAGDPAVDAAITTGGTGLSPDDVTVETVAPLFDREIAGFGERFRALSADEVGPRSMLSDATAGLVDGVVVFCLPGSQNAVELGVAELILPTIGHLLGLQDGCEAGPVSDQPTDRGSLTHVDDSGRVEMVDVGDKDESRRRAVASGRIELAPATIAAVRADEIGKGDVLATARIGAVDAVKHTWETVPMCHQIPITNVDTEFALGEGHVELTVAVETVGQTGCEMEAIQGVTTGLGVVWDMVKAAEKDDDGQYPGTRIQDVRVVDKQVEPVGEGRQ